MLVRENGKLLLTFFGVFATAPEICTYGLSCDEAFEPAAFAAETEFHVVFAA